MYKKSNYQLLPSDIYDHSDMYDVVRFTLTTGAELVVTVFQCRDLPPNQYRGTLDTFIRGILLPIPDDKFQTKTIMNTTDPMFNE